MRNECELCKRRISDWQMANGKCILIEQYLLHQECLADFYLRHGKMTIAETFIRLKGGSE